MLYKKTSSYSYEQYQSAIKKLKTFILKYTGEIYTPIIKKYNYLKENTDSLLERFCFTVVDSLNTKLEKIITKLALTIRVLLNIRLGFYLLVIAGKAPSELRKVLLAIVDLLKTYAEVS